MTVERVVVFLDWQNVYMRARESFHGTNASYTEGQVNPLDLALVLASRGAPDTVRELAEVRIYRGMPDQRFDMNAYAAARRQNASWSTNNKVRIFPRTLRYPDGWSPGWGGDAPREKGVDVSMALDVVTCGLDGLYDTGIVMSADQDLIPALEYLERRRISRSGPRTEVAAWRGDYGRRPNRISTGNGRPFCHWLTQQDYWGVQDTRDYTVATPPPTPGQGPRPGPHRRFN